MMGAKVGRRVYWPGTGFYCLDPELLDIGDDVVFGSRSELFTTDKNGSAKITIGNGGGLYLCYHCLPQLKDPSSHDRRSCRTPTWNTRREKHYHGIRSSGKAQWRV